MRAVLLLGQLDVGVEVVREARDRLMKDHCLFRSLALFPDGQAFVASVGNLDAPFGARSWEEILLESLTAVARDVPFVPCSKDHSTPAAVTVAEPPLAAPPREAEGAMCALRAAAEAPLVAEPPTMLARARDELLLPVPNPKPTVEAEADLAAGRRRRAAPALALPDFVTAFKMAMAECVGQRVGLEILNARTEWSRWRALGRARQSSSGSAGTAWRRTCRDCGRCSRRSLLRTRTITRITPATLL